MKIGFIAGEAMPFIKTGGLADVIGSLGKELIKYDNQVYVFIPLYKKIKDKYSAELELVDTHHVQVGDKKEYCGIMRTMSEGMTYIFIDNEYYFGARDSIYGDFDDGERFAFFQRATLDILFKLDIKLDILHLNDWHSGVIPKMLKHDYMHNPFYYDMKTVFTIHNLRFQGNFPQDLSHQLGLAVDESMLFDGQINFMKTAIEVSDYITTVSNTYRDEVMTSQYGENLEGMLRKKQDIFEGVVNGLDYDIWSPATDEVIAKQYTPYYVKSGKNANKEDLLDKFGLYPIKNLPLIGIVSRISDQKGFDLINEALDSLLKLNAQFILLGSGDSYYEEIFRRVSNESINFRAYIGYDENLAHLIYAGSDFFLMPSKFEPCGLSQLISLKYGSIPIVRETGGLKDTIVPYNKYENTGYGFSFANIDSNELVEAVKRGLELYKNQKHFVNVQRRCMELDFSWENSAKIYNRIYKRLKGEI
jgi:starch synthase